MGDLAAVVTEEVEIWYGQSVCTLRHSDVFRPRQTRQLPRAVYLKGRLLSCPKSLITTTPFHSLTERYSMNVDGNFN